MSRAVICPAILAADAHEFRNQMERIAPFANRVQIDLADGRFTETKTIGFSQIWWPESIRADLHLMCEDPGKYIETIIKLKPNLVIVHAEADGDFVSLAAQLHQNGIKVGVALLPETPISTIHGAQSHIDHILIFSGNLGHYGGKADLSLLGKVTEAKNLKPGVEVGWDGGVNAENALTLINNGVDVLNVGGFIQRSQNPKTAYDELISLV